MNLSTEITYAAIADVPGRQFFRCSALRSTLSVNSCATNWRRAQTLRADQVTGARQCRECPIGAAHAGEAHVRRSLIFGADFCPRCRRGGSRTISPRGLAKCISCFNRAAEVKRGRDGRGNVPQNLRLNPRRISVIVGHGSASQRQIEIIEPYTVDMIELILATLRLLPGKLAFSRANGRPGSHAISIADLAKQFGAPASTKTTPPPPLPRQRRTPAGKLLLPNEAEPQRRQNGTVLASRAALERLLERRVRL